MAGCLPKPALRAAMTAHAWLSGHSLQAQTQAQRHLDLGTLWHWALDGAVHKLPSSAEDGAAVGVDDLVLGGAEGHAIVCADLRRQ